LILVDTSVLIDFLHGTKNEKEKLFEAVLVQNLPFGITAYTYQEVLQGAKNESEYKKLNAYLSTQLFYFLPENHEAYEEAARLYFDLRRQGVTPRSTIDVLIASIAIRYGLYLLHNDHDFDLIASKTSGLKILRQLT